MSNQHLLSDSLVSAESTSTSSLAAIFLRSSLTSRIIKYSKILIGVSLSVATIGLVALYKCQNFLVYPSSLNEGRTYYDTPDSYGMPYEAIKIKTPDGETLDAFALKQDPTASDYTNKTVVILGPNAGNIAHYLPIVEVFYKYYGYNVFVYSYRGYGRSTGKASEIGLKTDAKAVLNYLADDEQYSNSSIILYGRSLGGAVAIYMASISSQYWESTSNIKELEARANVPLVSSALAEADYTVKQRAQKALNKNNEEEDNEDNENISNAATTTKLKEPNSGNLRLPKISGMILENTFLSIRKVIPYIFPILKSFAIFCNQLWPSENEIINVSPDIPVLFLNGLKDEIVPPSHMAKLYSLSRASTKIFEKFKKGYHNNTCNQPEYWKILHAFVKEHINPIE